MEIKGVALRVLKFLAHKKGSNPIVYGAISMALGMKTWEESAEASRILIENGLAENEKTRIWITQKGKDTLEEINVKESEEIYRTVFKDYFLSIKVFI
jgi:hypothetical protein